MVADASEMAKLTKGLPTKSEKMRVLANAGYKRSDIARFLGARYQFVRNVLEHERAKRANAAVLSVAPSDDLEQIAGPTPALRPTKLRLGPDGQLDIPSSFREALGLKEGNALIALVEDGEIHLLTMAAAAHRARVLVRQFVPEGISLVDELLEDRRREVEREEQNG